MVPAAFAQSGLDHPWPVESGLPRDTSAYVKLNGEGRTICLMSVPRQGEGAAAMPKIFTTCLVTGQPIVTGIEIDEASLARLPEFAGKIFCPHCGAEHEWSKDTARVAEGDKPS